ncbi:MAG: HAD family hydrolase [Lachnospiraceae bacterium]|nr:HAD family hydrolase [Lachnospiraceae bacterium]
MKLLFSDIDGTLILKDQTISPAVAEALDKMARAGHGLVLSSGRPVDSIMAVFKMIENRVPTPFARTLIIAGNGAQIYDRTAGEMLFEKRVPIPYVDKLQDLAESMEVHLQTYTDTHIICIREDAESERYRTKVILPLQISPRLSDALDKPPCKLLALSVKGSEALMPFRTRVGELFGDVLHTLFSGEGYLEIVAKDVDKGIALSYIAEKFGVAMEDTYAVGDYDNDLSMILAAGNGYAMANATESVKAAAPHVTRKANAEDGILEVLSAMMTS